MDQVDIETSVDSNSRDYLESSAFDLNIFEDASSLYDPSGEGCCGWKQTVPDENKANRGFLSAESRRYHSAPRSMQQHTQDSEDILVRDLNSLTMKEREEVLEEIHGVSDVFEETPALVTQRLKEMRLHVEKMPRKERKALDKAFFLKPTLAAAEKFWVMFLRANRFDPYLSARKMSRYFDHKLELFGLEKLVKKISFDDLTSADQEIIHMGTNIYLKKKDRSGRAVRVNSFSAYDAFGWKSAMRAFWYEVECLLEDEDVQKKGVVEVFHFYRTPRFSTAKGFQFLMNSRHIWEDWPYKICGVHVCFQNPTATYSFVNSVLTLMNQSMRVRLRVHSGSPVEAQYALLTFGINTAGCFEEGNGSLKRSHIKAKYEKRCRSELKCQMEEKYDSEQPIPFATSKDVLTGRGRSFWEHPGNVHLSSMAKMYAERYVAAEDRLEKTTISIDILQCIHASGGRFIQRSSAGWIEVDNEVAHRKISQCMRLRTRELKHSNKNATPVVSSLDSTRPPSECHGEEVYPPTTVLDARQYAAKRARIY